jgi:hypothetical protein
MNVFEVSSLSSVMGDPAGGPNSGIFIGKLNGVPAAKMRKRMLYPTYANSSGGNERVDNPLFEEQLYNESGQPLTGKDIQEIVEAHSSQTAFKGGSFVQIEPKCLAFPYCNQGAIDKPIRLIHPSKEGMCESCYEYCNTIGEQVGKTAEWVAEGFRQHTFKKLAEITKNDQQKVDQLLQSIEPSVDPSLFDKISTRIRMSILDPFTTFDDILRSIKQIIPTITDLKESIEIIDNKQKQNITEMFSLKVKNLSIQRRKELMEAMLTSPVAECIQTKLQAEGFLPLNEELNGMTLEESLKSLMEEEDIMNEMFNALSEGVCECTAPIQEWLKENFGEEGDDAEGSEEETPAEEPASDDSGSEELSTDDETPAFGAENGSEEPTSEPSDEPSADVTDIQPAEEPSTDITPAAPETNADGGELDSVIQSLLDLQTKLAGDEAQSELLGQVNAMLNQAKTMKGAFGVVGAMDTDTDMATSEPSDAVAMDVAVEPSDAPSDAVDAAVDAIAIDEAVAEIVNENPALMGALRAVGTAGAVSDALGVDEAGGVNTRKTLDQDFMDKVARFEGEFLDDLKWNSLRTYYNLSPEITPEQIHAYLKPAEDENGIAFFQRLTNLKNDPTGINRLLYGFMEPSKRGYIEKFGHKYDREFIDSLEDLMSEMFAKYQAITAMMNGSNYAGTGDEEGEEEENDTFNKDDFEDEFKDMTAEPTDAAIAATATEPVEPAAGKAKANRASFDKTGPLSPGGDNFDDEDEDDLLEGIVRLDNAVLGVNKENANETIDQAKEAVATQETEDQKVDDLKNQKFEASEAQTKIADKTLGMNNALDLDYDVEPSQEFKDRVLDQASGKAPADHVNVDHDSTGGQALIDAAKERAPENEKQFTSIPDATVVKDDEKYEVTTAVNEDIDRMKKLMTFDSTKLKENKIRKSVDEDKFLIERVQKKKFL